MSFFDDTPILFALRVVLALIFVTAAAGQVRHGDAFLGVLQNYQLLPKWALAPMRRVLPLAEFAVGIGFLIAPALVAPIGAGLLLVFAAAMAINIRRGRSYIDCGCHQTTLSQKLRWALVVRNGVLAALAVLTLVPRMLETEVVIVGAAAGLVLFITYLAMNTLLAIGPIEHRNIRISGDFKLMTALIISQSLLWITVLLMGLVILALARQVGVLHERLAPVGALTTGPGPDVGKASPRLTVAAMSGAKVQIGGKAATGRAQLLLFVSAVCPICKKIIPVSQGFARSEQLDVVFIGDSGDAEQRAMMAEYGIDADTFVNDREVGLLYQVGKLPYAVLIDPEGVIAAKGLVNSREHLESLVVSRETGYASIQSYIADKKISVIRR